MQRAAVVVLALAAALVPLPAWIVERYYSTRLYPGWQGLITTVSNTTPFALFDAFIVVVAGAWLILTGRDLARWRTRGLGGTVVRLIARTTVWAAFVYLTFFASWGLNYQRVRLIEKLELDEARVTDSGVRALASLAA